MLIATLISKGKQVLDPNLFDSSRRMCVSSQARNGLLATLASAPDTCSQLVPMLYMLQPGTLFEPDLGAGFFSPISAGQLFRFVGSPVLMAPTAAPKWIPSLAVQYDKIHGEAPVHERIAGTAQETTPKTCSEAPRHSLKEAIHLTSPNASPSVL